jgi:hypothetical protein
VIIVHSLVVQRESNKKGLPYLLGTDRLSSCMGVEHFHGISERGPEILKTAIKDVFKHVTVMLIHFHPGGFFNIIDGKFSRGDKNASEGAAREKPMKLDVKDQEEAVDVTGKVFMRLDLAACICGLVRREFGSAPRTFSAFVVVCGSAARAMSRSTTSIASSRSIFLVRHVAESASKTRKVEASATAGDDKSMPITRNTWGASPCVRSAQIRGAVSVCQESLIH